MINRMSSAAVATGNLRIYFSFQYLKIKRLLDRTLYCGGKDGGEGGLMFTCIWRKKEKVGTRYGGGKRAGSNVYLHL